MAADRNFPSEWLLTCKKSLINSAEWKSFSSDLQTALQNEMRVTGVKDFGDLSDNEKKLLINKAATTLKHGNNFEQFQQKLSKDVDEKLSQEVNKELLKSFPTRSDTKPQLLFQHVVEGASHLLKQWPEMKSKLKIFLNQPLIPFRELSWKLHLQNPSIAKEYCNILKRNPNDLMSVLDLEIIHKSEAALQTEPTFRPLANNRSILHAMKSILSYHHARKQTKTPLLEPDIMLAVPFLVVALMDNKPEELISRPTMLLMIQEYQSFMSTRPTYLKESYHANFQASIELFVSKLIEFLKRGNEDLATHIEGVCQKEDTSSSKEATSVLSPWSRLIRPMIRCFFVGYLTMDAVLFAWDQYILCLDSPRSSIVQVLTASVLLTLSRELKACHSLQEMQEVLKTKSRQVKKEELMYKIKKYFYDELKQELSQDQSSFHTFDPTHRAIAEPFHSLNSETLAPVVNAQDRRLARLQREQERQREIEKRNDMEKEEIKQTANRILVEKLEEDKKEKKLELENRHLQQQLEQERELRIKYERRARREIDRLIEELRSSRHLDSPPLIPESKVQTPPLPRISQLSHNSINPPVSPLSRGSTAKPKKDLQERSDEQAAKKTTLDVIQKVMQSFNHGMKDTSFFALCRAARTVPAAPT
ncbi:uncharacterized protein LOC117116216 [Anneissia japonica]|uniref:uncharacterized protein LOC117116216 n=1 Tax=Anneissia japonica TaxID=1529436 RepID=UPI00142581CC|nr:uncharacterized protein LOC117116216 [Anneissia japonica]